jgi:hypothetical protein
MIHILVSRYKSALTPKTKMILSSILASLKSYGVDQSLLLWLYRCLNKLEYPTKLCQARSCGGWHLPALRHDTLVARFIIMHKDECWIMWRWSISLRTMRRFRCTLCEHWIPCMKWRLACTLVYPINSVKPADGHGHGLLSLLNEAGSGHHWPHCKLSSICFFYFTILNTKLI